MINFQITHPFISLLMIYTKWKKIIHFISGLFWQYTLIFLNIDVYFLLYESQRNKRAVFQFIFKYCNSVYGEKSCHSVSHFSAKLYLILLRLINNRQLLPDFELKFLIKKICIEFLLIFMQFQNVAFD